MPRRLLILKGQVARGTLDLDTARPKGDLYTFQCAYGTVDGRTVYTQTWAVHLTEKPQVSTPHAPRAQVHGPPLPDAELTAALEDLKPTIQLGPCWR